MWNRCLLQHHWRKCSKNTGLKLPLPAFFTPSQNDAVKKKEQMFDSGGACCYKCNHFHPSRESQFLQTGMALSGRGKGHHEGTSGSHWSACVETSMYSQRREPWRQETTALGVDVISTSAAAHTYQLCNLEQVASCLWASALTPVKWGQKCREQVCWLDRIRKLTKTIWPSK